MGKVIYGVAGQEIEIDDRALAHLQAVIATKLRRGEGFFLNWREDPSTGDGHSAAWIGPNIPVVLAYTGSKPVELSRPWLEAMTMGANSNGGLFLEDEPSFESA